MSLLGMLLMLCIGAKAETVTATWDWQNGSPASITETNVQGTDATGVVASDVDGIKLNVLAAVTGTNIKLQYNASGYAQFNQNTAIRVPVISTNDVVTIVSFPGQSKYTVGGEDATGQNTFTYTATKNDVKQGYVEIIASATAYLYSIKVVQDQDAAGNVAQDVTATWSWQNATPESITSTNIQGTDATGTVASNITGIQLDVLAAVTGTNVKLQYNASGYAQFNQNTAIRVPVKNKGDLVTVVSYPGQSKYTVGGEDATGQNTFTHNASTSEASKGYVEIVASATAYLYSISVTQYAPKEAITLDNEAVTATFPFDLGTTGQKATFSNAEYFISSKVALGSNLEIYGVSNKSGFNETQIQPTKIASGSKASAGDAANYVKFIIRPKFGFTFTPSKVSIKSTRYGTNDGLLDFYWQNADGTTIVLEKSRKPNRENGLDENKQPSDYKYTQFEYSLESATAGEGACGLLIDFYNLANNKQMGFADIVIEGTLSGTEVEVPILSSFTINGTEYSVDNVFGDDYEATLKISKSETMIGSENPLTATASSGDIGTITYEGNETQCVATIPMTAGSVSLSYVLNVIQKPDYTLSYYNLDGSVIDTQVLEEGQTIGKFKVDIADVEASQDGYMARGWFKNNYVGEKYQITDVVTSDLSLYAVETEIEVSSESKKYEFDLKDKNFDAEDHEAFVPVGNGKWHDTTHGWDFKSGDQIQLLVGSKASIIITTCKYPENGTTTIDASNGKSVPAVSATDGTTQAIEYEGEPGTLTLTINGGQAYIHKLVILNTAETNYEKEGQWIKVKAGDASSLIDAIDAANGTPGDERIFIYLPNGTYDLAQTTLTTVGRSNVSIIGESMEGTIIKNRPIKEGINITATILNTGSNNYFQDLTLDCIAPYGTGDDTKSAERGVCLQDKGDQTICKNVYLKGLQDSYYSNNSSGTYYFEDSKIEGSVDYVCGNGDVYFNKTYFNTVNKSSGANGGCIAAPNTKKSFGYIFSDCTLGGMSNEAGTYRLGRPWAANTIIRMINTKMIIAPKEEGWAEWSDDVTKQNAVVQFAEYKSVDANDNLIDLNNRKASFAGQANNPVITEEEVANYTVSAIFSGDWKPNTLAAQAAAPAAKIENGVITITPANGGDAGVYLIEKDGEFLALTSETTYNVSEQAEEGNKVTAEPVYTVRAANKMGGFGEAAVATVPTAIEVVEATAEAANAAEGAFVIDGKVVIVKEGKQFTAAGARIK